MTKAEREELRRLLRSRFKVLRADVDARRAELEVELAEQVDQKYAAKDKQIDDARFKLKQIRDDANRQANDLARELYGKDAWGTKADRALVSVADLPNPHYNDRNKDMYDGKKLIEARVTKAKLELERQETELLTELALGALESQEAQAFFSRIPTIGELVPAFRVQEIAS